MGPFSCLALEGCDSAFEFTSKRSEFGLNDPEFGLNDPEFGLNDPEFGLDVLDARFKISESTFHTTESGPGFVAVRSYLDGDHVEELQNLRLSFVFHAR
jgi:hypothetical protein